MSRSPALPWEVIERVIDHSAKNIGTLYSFTLTCSDLRPSSTTLLFNHVTPKTRDQLFDLCNVLQAKPHLQSCVRAVTIPAREFSPHPLLRILPKLSEINFFDNCDEVPYSEDPPITVFHQSIIKHCRQFGQNIHTLSLKGITFASLSTFSDILLLLPRIQSLSCDDLHVKNSSQHREHFTRRLSERLHLTTLDIGHRPYTDDAVFTLLVEAVKHSVENIVYILRLRDSEEEIKSDNPLLASPSDWVQLTSFIWKWPRWDSEGWWQRIISQPGLDIPFHQQAINVLRNCHPPKLREVTMEIGFQSFRSFALVQPSELWTELESVLMTFPQPMISCYPYNSDTLINIRRYHSWMRMLEGYLPELAKRGALTINAEYSGFDGHDGPVWTPIIISADSRWAATGSEDGTIIIWDLDSGCIYQEWFAEICGVDSLAFSPNSQYIISTSGGSSGGRSTPTDKKRQSATIWGLHQGGHRVRSLMGEDGTGTIESSDWYTNCAWSPDGRWIAAGPLTNDDIHIWETTTFQRRHPYGTAWKGLLLACSANGCWVITTSQYLHLSNSPDDCCIWDVESGELHRSLSGHTNLVTTAAFNSESTRVVTGAEDSTVRIWDAETGEQLLVLQSPEKGIGTVAFSRDGRMVLSQSWDASNRGGLVKVWDAFNGALLADLSDACCKFCKAPHAACFSPCGSYIAAPSKDGEALLWRTSDWSCIAKVSGGGGKVTHVAISPDGRVLCCGTDKGTVFFRRMHDLVSASQD